MRLQARTYLIPWVFAEVPVGIAENIVANMGLLAVSQIK